MVTEKANNGLSDQLFERNREAFLWAEKQHLSGKKVGISMVFAHTFGFLIVNLIFCRKVFFGAQAISHSLVEAQYEFNKYLFLFYLSNSEPN